MRTHRSNVGSLEGARSSIAYALDTIRHNDNNSTVQSMNALAAMASVWFSLATLV
jgi:hypothetical protein